MNDYLGHIASRSLRRAVLIQPRLGSVFEPAGHEHSLGRGEKFSGKGEENFALNSAEISPRPLSRKIYDSRFRSALESDDTLAETESRCTPVQRTATQTTTPPLPSSAPATASNPVSLVSSSVFVKVEAPATRPREVTAQPLLDHTQSLATPRTESRPAPPMTEPVVPSMPRSRNQKEGNVQRGPAEDAKELHQPAPQPRLPLSPVTPTAESLIKPKIIESAAPALQRSDPPLPPIIRVTIGRVEVRAIMPSAPATQSPTQSKPALMLSLDEYLKRQSG